MVLGNQNLEDEFSVIPEFIIYKNILSKLPVEEIKSVSLAAHEKYLKSKGVHIFDCSISGIEFFSKIYAIIKKVVYWNIPKDFLFLPKNPECLYFSGCKNIVNVNSFKNLKRLTLINTKFETINLSLLPHLEYLRIEYFRDNFDNKNIFVFDDYFFKSINKIKVFININGRIFKSKKRN